MGLTLYSIDTVLSHNWMRTLSAWITLMHIQVMQCYLRHGPYKWRSKTQAEATFVYVCLWYACNVETTYLGWRK